MTQTYHRSTWDDRMPGNLDVAGAIGSILGVIILVIGVVTVARTGIPANDLTAASTAVGPFSRTTLMGIIEVVLGLLLIGAGSTGNGLRGLGLVFSVFGLVWLIEPGAFQGALGITHATGWLYLLVGLLALAGGLVSSGYLWTRRSV